MQLVNVLDYCTSTVTIPDGIGNVVHLAVLAIQIVVPILLIIWGMLDFAKAVIGQDEEKIKAGQKTFIKRLIAAVIVFLIVTIVRLAVSLAESVGGEGNQAENAWSCVQELINGK